MDAVSRSVSGTTELTSAERQNIKDWYANVCIYTVVWDHWQPNPIVLKFQQNSMNSWRGILRRDERVRPGAQHSWSRWWW